MWMPKIISELLIAALVILVITLIKKKFVNQEALKKIKEEMKNLQKKVKEIEKTNPDQAKSLSAEMMKLANKQMSMNYKSLIPTMLFVIIFLPWVALVYSGSHVAMLPFTLPYFGNDFGWLMWYFIASLPLTLIFNKLLDVEA
jgi:uncharacterized membrane protein (DUF106 family)